MGGKAHPERPQSAEFSGRMAELSLLTASLPTCLPTRLSGYCQPPGTEQCPRALKPVPAITGWQAQGPSVPAGMAACWRPVCAWGLS